MVSYAKSSSKLKFRLQALFALLSLRPMLLSVEHRSCGDLGRARGTYDVKLFRLYICFSEVHRIAFNVTETFKGILAKRQFYSKSLVWSVLDCFRGLKSIISYLF